MFDFTMLNDYEFESLCKDIMQIHLDTPLYIFPRGVDQGIDICDKGTRPEIMIQVKHYANSSFSSLRRSLKEEIAKVNKHNPTKYIIMTSYSLTRQNKIEILNLFPKYMKNISDIWGKNEIDSFLAEAKNTDIVQKNFKLWINASNVLSIIQNQNIYLDSYEFLENIESKIGLFVDTKAYIDALNKIIEHNILIIVGAPGVGKSTISEMIILHYVAKDYSIRYVTNNDISDLKKAVSMAADKKEIILLDDFLGQHYLKIREDQPNELKTLLSFVNRNKSKKIILNSRITILNEAREISLKFDELMNRYEVQKYLVDLDQISKYEKAKILYNHLFFNKVPKEYFKEIARDNNYMKIVNHKNYNPRIIEYVTKKRNFESVTPKSYYSYIFEKMDNPTNVWQDEFENRMVIEDRCLMNTLYSLTDTQIEKSVLERAFNARIRDEGILDTTYNHFNKTMKRLTNSLLVIKSGINTRNISVLNPSINDYVSSEIKKNQNEQIKIMENAIYYEQVRRIDFSNETASLIKKDLFRDDILQFKTLENSIFYYFLEKVVENDLLDKRLFEKVRLSVERAYENLSIKERSDYNILIEKLFFNEEFFEFYDLASIFKSEEKLYHIIEPLNTEMLSFVFKELGNQELITSRILDTFKTVIEKTSFDELCDELTFKDYEIVSRMQIDENPQTDEDYQMIEEEVLSDLSESIAQNLEKKFEFISNELVIERQEIFIDNLLSEYDVANTVYGYFTESDDENPFVDRTDHDDNLIKVMFER